MPVYVTVRNGPFRGMSKLLVRKWAVGMLRKLDLASAELSVALTNDEEIRELNRTFRRKDKPTDVLAFAMREGKALGPNASARGPVSRVGARVGEMLGDVVVSVETAARQAALRKRPLEAEVRMLVAHGLLHLVGYDHGTDGEERIMTRKTRELCRAAVQPSARAN